MCVKNLRLPMRWLMNLLPLIRSFFLPGGLRDRDRSPRANRLINPLNDADIRQALQPRRLRLLVAQNAIREVHQFGRKLVSFRKVSCPLLAIDRYLPPNAFCVFVSGICAKNALAPNQPKAAYISNAKAAGKCRQPFPR